MPALVSVSRSKPRPVTLLPPKSPGRRRNASGFWSMTATEWPCSSRFCASDAPTRPQPMMTKCTAGHAIPPRTSTCDVLGVRTIGVVSDLSDAAKRLLLGRPVRSENVGHTLLPKRVALPVFASDALSSVAYAPDEILLTLSMAGLSALVISPWVGAAVAIVMLTVVASYRQNVRAYPSGGGDYEVATVNLGPNAGVTVASALLVDYVLTVAVSISSGAQYAATAFPPLRGHEALFAIVLVVLLTIAKLRGVKESGTAFAIPVYLFMLAIGLIAVVGAVRYLTGTLPMAESAGLGLTPEAGYEQGLTGVAGFFLVLRAFASGCAALTGVEAISNGVPALKKPKSKNAATTLALLGGLSIVMIMSILLLSRATGVVFADDEANQLLLDG